MKIEVTDKAILQALDFTAALAQGLAGVVKEHGAGYAGWDGRVPALLEASAQVYMVLTAHKNGQVKRSRRKRVVKRAT